MTLQIKAEVLLNNSNWEKNLRKTSKQMEGFGKSMKTISNGVKAAWAGVAALGFSAVADAIVDVTKAAAEDNKSMALLNKQMDNSWKATTAQKEAMDQYIDSMSNMSGIADDNLRPAMSKIVTATKSVSKAQKAFAMVLDISAGTGKDVNVVAQAYQKYLMGTEGALNKLVPGLKDADNQMKFLQDRYGGMAAIAGNNDPFARISVVMDNFKEKLGTAFLPVVQKFSDWLASPEAQKSLDELAAKVQEFGAWFASPEGQKTFEGWMEDLKAMIKLAGDFLGIAGEVAAFLSGKTGKKNQNDVLSSPTGRTAMNPFRGGLGYSSMDQQLGATGNMSTIGKVIINVNAPNVSGAAVLNAINGEARRRGIPLSKLLG